MGLFNIFKNKKTKVKPLNLENFDEILEFDEALYQKNLRDHDWSHYVDDGCGEDE